MSTQFQYEGEAPRNTIVEAPISREPVTAIPTDIPAITGDGFVLILGGLIVTQLLKPIFQVIVERLKQDSTNGKEFTTFMANMLDDAQEERAKLREVLESALDNLSELKRAESNLNKSLEAILQTQKDHTNLLNDVMDLLARPALPPDLQLPTKRGTYG